MYKIWELVKTLEQKTLSVRPSESNNGKQEDMQCVAMQTISAANHLRVCP